MTSLVKIAYGKLTEIPKHIQIVHIKKIHTEISTRLWSWLKSPFETLFWLASLHVACGNNADVAACSADTQPASAHLWSWCYNTIINHKDNRLLFSYFKTFTRPSLVHYISKTSGWTIFSQFLKFFWQMLSLVIAGRWDTRALQSNPCITANIFQFCFSQTINELSF